MVPDRSRTPPSAARRIAPLVVIGAGTAALVLATGPFGLVLPVFARWLRDQALVRIAAAGLLLAGLVTVGFNWSLVAETVFELRPREVTQVLCTIALAAVFARARGDRR